MFREKKQHEETTQDSQSPSAAQHYSIADDVCSAVADTSPPADPALGRRDFLKFFSAGVALASSSCVRRPAEHAIPYVNQPVDQVPGVATWYSTTCGGCPSACGITVKTREGRPVKIEGNKDHQLSGGALCPLGQAGLQGLYHPERYPQPRIKRGDELKPVTWDDVYLHLSERLQKTTKIGIFTGGTSGHRHQFLREVLQKLGAKASSLYTYEPNLLPTYVAEAHRQAFGKYVIPRCDLEKAELIVGIGSDFLDQGLSRVAYARSFTRARDLSKDKYCELVQFESALSLTGARADTRTVIAPNSEINIALALTQALYRHPQAQGSPADRRIIAALLQKQGRNASIDTTMQKKITALAAELLKKPAVVLCGGSHNFDRNAMALQTTAIAINILIGAYDAILDIRRAWQVPPVQSNDLERFAKEAEELEALFIIDSDPFFSLPPSFAFAAKIKNVKHLISMQSFPNVSDQHATHVLPVHHYLEAWGDEQALAGVWTTRQPVVRPTTDSRQSEDVLLWLLATIGKPMPYADYRAYLRKKWQKLHDLSAKTMPFADFQHDVLQRGTFTHDLRQAVGELQKLDMQVTDVAKGLKLSAPLDNRLHDGRGAHLPVLQEVGDSLTTIAWDSWVALSVDTAQKMGFRRNDVLQIKSEAGSFQAALFPLPGLHDDAVVVPRGNGQQRGVSKVTDSIGVNPLVAFAVATVTSGQQVSIVRTGKTHRLAAMQKENTLGNRSDIVKTVTLTQLKTKLHQDLDAVPDLYPKLEEAEHRWGLSVDLHKCIGCSACMVACAQENNIPQVGRNQVAMGREMHWIRLDRYFSGQVTNPRVTIQPMMCQQCNHAPCEAVCPVYATTHDAEGINAMTYNRCVGTRYCANACPYKVRRFNWWTHKWNVIDAKDYNRNPRALNPDVTVRTRGVMEKCNFCYQRIRDGKHRAQAEKRQVKDQEIKTACQQTCPTEAITFGNLKDVNSKVAEHRRDPRAYLALGGHPEIKEYGLKTLPNVNYLANVTLHEEGGDEHG